MILVSYVNVHSRKNIVAYINAIVTNDRTSTTYQTSISNNHDWVSHHLLVGHHSSRQGHISGNHRVFTNAYPTFSVHVSCGPVNYRSAPEVLIKASSMIVGANRRCPIKHLGDTTDRSTNS
tara:strand:- start:2632 stop:2994 length:363 start_codon:yes stop_codon:yes gene_type:complete